MSSTFLNLPSEIILEISKFLPSRSLIEFISTCRQFYNFFKNYRSKLPDLLKCFNYEQMNDTRLKYINHSLTQKNLSIDNCFQSFNNLVVLDNDISFAEYYSRTKLFEKADMCENLGEFQERFHSRIGSTAKKVVIELFKHSASKRYKFIVAGSSVLNCFTSRTKNFNDVDVFLIHPERDFNSGEYMSTETYDLKNFLVNDVHKVIEPQEYRIFINKSYLSICLKDEPTYLQINFRTCRTIEELLTFFDLDCCRFAYDGKNIITTRQGLRFLNLGINFIPDFQKKICFMNRLEKYYDRGIDTVYTVNDEESSFHTHPLLLYFTKRELTKLTNSHTFRKSKEYIDQKNKKNEINDENNRWIRRHRRTRNTDIINQNNYLEIIQNHIYRYRLTNFPMTYEELKKRCGASKKFHGSHDCIHLYDKYSYFILPCLLSVLDGGRTWTNPGGVSKRMSFVFGMIDFGYYYRICTRYPAYYNDPRRTDEARKHRVWVSCRGLDMLGFIVCPKCMRFAKDKNHSVECKGKNDDETSEYYF